jgi:hypothetical protein
MILWRYDILEAERQRGREAGVLKSHKAADLEGLMA